MQPGIKLLTTGCAFVGFNIFNYEANKVVQEYFLPPDKTKNGPVLDNDVLNIMRKLHKDSGSHSYSIKVDPLKTHEEFPPPFN